MYSAREASPGRYDQVTTIGEHLDTLTGLSLKMLELLDPLG